MTVFPEEAHTHKKDAFPEAGISKWEAGGQHSSLGRCRCESEARTKGKFGAVSQRGTIVFSSENLSPTAQEQ